MVSILTSLVSRDDARSPFSVALYVREMKFTRALCPLPDTSEALIADFLLSCPLNEFPKVRETTSKIALRPINRTKQGPALIRTVSDFDFTQRSVQ